MNERKLRRKQIRKDVSSYGWALLIYYGLMTVCVVLGVYALTLAKTMTMALEGNVLDLESLDMGSAMNDASGYLAACILAVVLIWAWKGKVFFRSLWKSGETMTPAAFFQLVCVFISGQLAFQICATIQEAVLNQFGLSILEAMERATAGTGDSLTMFLYMSLGAPRVEEIIFRGAVLRGLEKHGQRFAILVSALLFGLFHGNIIQSPYAFVVGLVLGYVTVKYNIVWAMVLHMINNMLLGNTLGRLTQGLGEIGSGLVLQAVILICTGVAIFALIRNRREVLAYHRADKPDWDAIHAFATAPGVLVLIALMEFSAFSMLFL